MSFTDTDAFRILAQAIIGGEFVLKTHRGKVVLNAEAVADFFEKRARAQVEHAASVQGSGDTSVVSDVSDQVRSVLQVVAGVEKQLSRALGKPDKQFEVYIHVDEAISKINKSIIELAGEMLSEKYASQWRVHTYRPNRDKWGFCFILAEK
jgi:hypothetical protein